MGDYIERQAVLNAYDAVQRKNGPWRFETLIESVPAADVRPAVRGRWRWVGQDQWNDCYECSQCGKMNTDNSNFCPNCGAYMRGGDEDGE